MVTRAGWGSFTLYTVLGMLGLLITGIYVLKALQKVLHGPLGEEWRHHPLTDISWTEIAGVAPLMVAMLALGLWPRLVMDVINSGVVRFLQLALVK